MGILGTEYSTTVILGRISYAGKHTGNFAVTQHLQLRKDNIKTRKNKTKGKEREKKKVREIKGKYYRFYAVICRLCNYKHSNHNQLEKDLIIIT